MEVLVGALVLSITTLAVLNGLDGAAAVGSKNINRSQNAALAQQDIERLRSLPITALANLRQTRTVTVRGVDYTVVSRADWVNDGGGVIGCTDTTLEADYLKITSKVHSPASVDKPVTETTLLTPAPGEFSTDRGTATVRLTDRDGNPLSGTTVNLTGPGSYADTTNDVGCAVFALVPVGDYTASVSGGVSWDSEIPATAVITVNEGHTSLTQIEVETPASVRAHFKTPSGVRGSASWNVMRLAHAKLPGGYKTFPDPFTSTRSTTFDAINLFPQLSAYGVYAGDCDANNPSFWDGAYFQPDGPGHALLNPGDNLVDVDVVMPTVTFRVTQSSTTASRIRVVATQTDNPVGDVDCRETFPRFEVAAAGGGTFDVTVAVPFGNYTFCVDDGRRAKRSTTSTQADGDNTSNPERHNLIPGQPIEEFDTLNYSSGASTTLCPS